MCASQNALSFIDTEFWFIPHEVSGEEAKEADSALLQLLSQSLNTCKRAKMMLSAPCGGTWKLSTQCMSHLTANSPSKQHVEDKCVMEISDSSLCYPHACLHDRHSQPFSLLTLSKIRNQNILIQKDLKCVLLYPFILQQRKLRPDIKHWWNILFG